jgi:hypothetical protein
MPAVAIVLIGVSTRAWPTTARNTVVRVAASVPGATRIVATPRDLDRRGSAAPVRCSRRHRSRQGLLDNHRREGRSARLALVVPGLSPRLPLRLTSPTKHLLRRQPVSPRDSRYLFATLIAFGQNLRLLVACPRTASARASKHFQPAYRLKLGFGRKLSVRHVSNPLDSAGRNFAHQRSALKVGSKAP